MTHGLPVKAVRLSEIRRLNRKRRARAIFEQDVSLPEDDHEARERLIEKAMALFCDRSIAGQDAFLDFWEWMFESAKTAKNTEKNGGF